MLPSIVVHLLTPSSCFFLRPSQSWRHSRSKREGRTFVTIYWYHWHLAIISTEEEIGTHFQKYYTRWGKRPAFTFLSPAIYLSLSAKTPVIYLIFQDTVSVCRPSFYAQRFQDFMAKTVFKKIPSRKFNKVTLSSSWHSMNSHDRKDSKFLRKFIFEKHRDF